MLFYCILSKKGFEHLILVVRVGIPTGQNGVMRIPGKGRSPGLPVESIVENSRNALIERGINTKVFENCWNWFKGVDSSSRNSLINKQRKHSDIGPHVEDTGIGVEGDTMLEIAFGFKN